MFLATKHVQKRLRVMFYSLTFSLFLPAFPAYSLTCDEVRQLTTVFFRLHYSSHAFDDELSQKVLTQFHRYWDPGKLYFLEADIKKFEIDYGDKLDNLIAKSNCTAVKAIMAVYSKRYDERMRLIKKIIEEKHDFTKDEYLSIDRKNEKYAKTTEEVAERWRKRIKFQLLQLKQSIPDYKLVKEKLQKRYQLEENRQKEIDTNDVYESFLNAFSLALDPHSEYMGPDKLEDFRINTRLSLEGIGAVLRSEDGFTKIQSLVTGGAAEKTGKLKPDDKIIAVGQGDGPPVDVIDMDLKEVVKLIRGPRGTTVRLTAVREDKGGSKKFLVDVVREKVELKDRGAKSFVYNVNAEDKKGKKTGGLKVGLIDLPSFYIDFEGRQARKDGYKSCSEDVKVELENLKKQKIDLLLLDLRSNGGGSLDESIKLAGLFIKDGPVVQVKNMDGSIQVHSDDDKKVYYDGPLVVLINKHSASASEIFAGAIKDYKRGLLVGDSHTFGKGTVQNLTDLSESLGAIKVTISKFYRPSGLSTQMNGVEADVVLPSLLDEMDVGEKYYDYALAFEKIEPAKYKVSQNEVDSYAEKIQAASKDRITKDKEFQELMAEIKKYHDNESERSRVSLKEEKEKKDETKGINAKTEDIESEEGISPASSGKKLTAAEENLEHIKKDIYLQEAIRIGADYYQSLVAKAPLPEKTTIVELKDFLIAEEKAKEKKILAEKTSVKKSEKIVSDTGKKEQKDGKKD